MCKVKYRMKRVLLGNLGPMKIMFTTLVDFIPQMTS